MQTKITLIIDNPVDPSAFETVYPSVLERASALPGLRRLESARVFPKEDGTATPAHRTLDLYFDDYAAASDAVASPEAGQLFDGLGATNTSLSGLFSEVELG